jgi:mRNA-degrading endonuclease RelE of RelBE toxin-antitoxin system
MAIELKINPLITGDKFTVCEILRDGKSDLQKFFNKLENNIKAETIQLIEYIAKYGPPRNSTKFRHEKDGIWAIKPKQVRIYCFYDKNNLIILTNGAIKKSRKANPEDLEKAIRLKKQWDDRRR